MQYSMTVRNARLGAVRDALNGGALEVLDLAGGRIASIPLDKVSGEVGFGLLVFSGFPKVAIAERNGKATSARFVDREGAIVVFELSVGVVDADIVLAGVEIEKGNAVKLDLAEIRS